MTDVITSIYLSSAFAFIGFALVFCLWAWAARAPSMLYGALLALFFLPMVGFNYYEDMQAAKWVESINKETPMRDIGRSEALSFGADAVRGVVYGATNDTHRLYCVTYFDDTQKAILSPDFGHQSDHLQTMGLCDEA